MSTWEVLSKKFIFKEAKKDNQKNLKKIWKLIMHYEIRNYHITDLSALYKICLQTANNGSDASSLLEADLAGHLFAAPYAFFEPELCFILSLDANPYGYVLGAKNSVDFLEKCEKIGFLNYVNVSPYQMKRTNRYSLTLLDSFIKNKI